MNADTKGTLMKKHDMAEAGDGKRKHYSATRMVPPLKVKAMACGVQVHKVGDRVKVKPGKEHDEMTKGQTGTVVEVSTPALAVRFDKMTKIHKWYTSDEIEPA